MTEFIKMSTSHENNKNNKNILIDDRYSRQSYSIGRESTKKISGSRVLVIGYDILGEEIIKNLILMGFGRVDINCQNDINELKKENLFFNIENNSIPYDKLKKLNPNTSINVVNIKDENNELMLEMFKNYSIVVIVNSQIVDASILNKITRTCEIPLIIAGTSGLFGYIFNDFGETFEIEDQDGLDYENLIPQEIIDNTIKFKVKHKLNNGDIVRITYSNNFKEERQIADVIDAVTIKFKDNFATNDIHSYTHIFKRKIKKITKNITFEEFVIKKMTDKIMISDFSVPFDRNELLFNLYLALNKYFDKFNELPKAWSQVDYEIFINLLKEINQDIITENNEKFIKKFCYTSGGNFKPLASIIGGIVSHEVIKAMTRKYIPIDQGLFMDFINDLIMDEELENINQEDYVSMDKYKSVVNIFGSKFVEKMRNVKPFVIGSGAIGCEILKNLCCLGIKKITITDNDNIEKSNLSRQLLFNDGDIGKSKSNCAGNAIMNKNSDCIVNIYESRIEDKTKYIFNDKFHCDIDIYLNALDNIEARKYMDMTAVQYSKPIIDSGTTGGDGSIGVIIPHLTESYRSTRNDTDDEAIPICTLKEFPFKTEHTIQWARELFEENFNIIPKLIKKYTENNFCALYNETDIELMNVYKLLYKFKNFIFDKNSFTIYGKVLFYENFVEKITEIINKYKDKPENTNKLPIYLDNSAFEQIFISYTFIMLNQMFGTSLIYYCDDMELINNNINITNYYVSHVENIDKFERNYLQNELYNILLLFVTNLTPIPIEFEKDNEDLQHVKWISCVANTRNFQYSIDQIDEYETRKIAGKIIPAMVTTTSVVSAHQIIEMIKIIKLYKENKYLKKENEKDIEIYKNRFINMNLNYHVGNEVTPCDKYYYIKEEINNKNSKENTNYLTLWSKFKLETNRTEDIVKQINEKTNKYLNLNLNLYSISSCDDVNKYYYEQEEVIKHEYINSRFCAIQFNEYDIDFYLEILCNNSLDSSLNSVDSLNDKKHTNLL